VVRRINPVSIVGVLTLEVDVVGIVIKGYVGTLVAILDVTLEQRLTSNITYLILNIRCMMTCVIITRSGQLERCIHPL
jgi:hypothetical protein